MLQKQKTNQIFQLVVKHQRQEPWSLFFVDMLSSDIFRYMYKAFAYNITVDN